MTCVTTTRKHFLRLATLVFVIGGTCNSLFAAEPAVVLIIRVGALHPAELSPEENVTPTLRSLVRGGGSVASSHKDEGSEKGDLAQNILDRVMPPRTIKELDHESISTVIIDPDRKAGRGSGKTTSAGGNAALSAGQAQALAELERHVGNAKQISPEEATVVTSLKKILGLGSAAASSTKSDTENDQGKASRTDIVATRVQASLKKGAGLVVVLERVDSNTAAAAGQRDTLLEAHRQAVTTHEGATLAILSFSSATSTSGLLVLWGPKIHSGWVVPRNVGVEDLEATLLWLVGKSLNSKRELIDDLLLD